MAMMRAASTPSRRPVTRPAVSAPKSTSSSLESTAPDGAVEILAAWSEFGQARLTSLLKGTWQRSPAVPPDGEPAPFVAPSSEDDPAEPADRPPRRTDRADARLHSVRSTGGRRGARPV